MRAAMNAIFYLLRTGCPWRDLPRDPFPPRSMVYNIFRKFQHEGSPAAWTPAAGGGAIEQGMSAATGASVTCLDRNALKRFAICACTASPDDPESGRLPIIAHFLPGRANLSDEADGQRFPAVARLCTV
jgi:hypothetical protein